jgi:hypothetical protein
MARGNYCPDYAIASFKGVQFDAMEVTSEHGRRGHEGEFPFAEHTGYVDLGRKIRKYTLSGRFVENTHIKDAAVLIAACESPGPGPLIHPTRGTIIAACTEAKFKDDVLEGKGITTCELSFVEANFNISPVNLLGNFLSIDIGGILDAAGISFSSSYFPELTMYFDVASVVNSAVGAVQFMRGVYYKNIGINGTVDQWQVLGAFDDAIASSSSFKVRPYALEQIMSSIKVIDNYVSDADKYDAFRSVANWAAQNTTLNGVGGKSQNAVFSLVRISAAAEMAKALIDNPPVTMSDALAKYDAVMALLENEAQIAKANCNDKLFLQLRDFASIAGRRILSNAYNKPSTIRYDFGASVHSLVASFSIYGDAKRFAELEAANTNALPFLLGPIVSAKGV